jgi:hypothetical protein
MVDSVSNFPLGNGIETPDATYTLEQVRDKLGFPDSAGRLRVVVDAITGALTLATVTTVGTVTTVSNVANVTQVGGLQAAYDQVAAFNTMPAMNRNQIAVS